MHQDKLKIGIIDSGVDNQNERIMKFVGNGICINQNGTISDKFDDKIGHGTAVVDLITRNMNFNDVELFIIKIFDEELGTSKEKLFTALEIAIENQVDILNCSLGTIDVDAQFYLKDIITQIVIRGIIVVSAWNDENYTTWPANFSNVISVKGGELTKLDEWIYEKDKKEHFIFRGVPTRTNWKDGKKIFIGGSSFATALCTNLIATIIIANNIQKNLDHVISYLKQNAGSKKINDLTPSKHIKWNNFHSKIKKVGLYPFFKEMHSFVRFRNKLPYKISWIADFNTSKNSQKSTNEVLENCTEEIFINSGLPLEHYDVDTLIIGYLDKASEAHKKDMLLTAIEYAYQRNLNVFSFLPPQDYQLWKNKFEQKDLWLEVPFIDFEYGNKIIYEVPEKKAFDTPIIGVFGTSSQQGKFTFQLELRYELQKRGLRIGQIGTEHQSGCFGIDFTFPNGYGFNQSIQIPMDFHVPLLRRVLSEMDKGQFDVIVVGGQSGLLSPSFYNYINFFSQLILLASIPDRVILLHNYNEEHLIERINQYIHSITGQNIYSYINFDKIIKNEISFKESLVNLFYD
jgi:uncharacterized NAD-dependent epimerase/dehydratase family protein